MLNNLTNFFNIIRGKRIKTQLEDSDLIAIGTKQSPAIGDYKPTAIQFKDLATQIGGLQTVDVDGVTITGNGTLASPLVVPPAAINYSTVLFVDPVFGEDVLLQPGRFDKPLLTIFGALSAANAFIPKTETNRVMIWVRKGLYKNQFLPPYSNIDVYCEAGVVFIEQFTLWDSSVGSAVNFNWYGFAKWNINQFTTAFRAQFASTMFIQGDTFVSAGGVFTGSNVNVEISNTIFDFNSMESTQTLGNAFAFTWRNNCNGVVNVKNYIKSNHISHDIRASHSGLITVNCPRNIMTSLNLYGSGFKHMIYAASASSTSKLVINGDMINESPNIGGNPSMCVTFGSVQTEITINGNIYANDAFGPYSATSNTNGKIIVNGSIFSNIDCFVNEGAGDSFFRNGIMVLANVVGAIRLGRVSGTGKVWLTDMQLNSDLVGDCIQQTTNTSKVFMKSITSESGGVDFINASVAGTINQFTNCVSNKPLSANVTNELAQGLIVDALIKTPKF